MTTKDSRKRELEGHIERVEAKIADFDKRVLEDEGDLQTYYREALIKLTEVRKVADGYLEQLQDSGEEAWDELKDDMDHAIERLRSNLDSLIARFSDDAVDKPAVQRKRKPAKRGAGKPRAASARTNRGKRR